MVWPIDRHVCFGTSRNVHANAQAGTNVLKDRTMLRKPTLPGEQCSKITCAGAAPRCKVEAAEFAYIFGKIIGQQLFW